MNRRTFIKTTTAAGVSAAMIPNTFAGQALQGNPGRDIEHAHPIILSTWDFKLPVNETAYSVMMKDGGSVLDAVEQSIRIVEEDPKTTSVGRGGFPDREGHLTLDACIMDEKGNAGSVVFLEHIMHPISVARKVMEKTPHVMIAGEGALQFALEQGFPKEDLLSGNAKKEYKKWLESSKYVPKIGKENHDTIGLVAMDTKGNLAGGCSTSGAAWKMHGRIGDSPLIGAGLFVDNEVGAATATGLGETVIKIAGSFLVVESMRNGKSPQEACQIAVERLIHKQPQYKDIDNFLAGFVALNKNGEVGAFSYKKGLQYSLHKDGVNKVFDAGYLAEY